MVLDIILILIVGLSVFLGYRKGLFKMVIRLATVVVCLAVALSLQGWVTDMLSNTSIYETVYTGLSTKVEDSFGEQINSLASGEAVTNLIEKLNLPESISEGIVDSLNINKAEKVDEISDKVYDKVAHWIINAIAFVLLFVISLILFSVLAVIVEKILQLPGLNLINRSLGACVGAALGVIICVLLLNVVTMFMSSGGIVSQAAKDSFIYMWYVSGAKL